jgi:AhpD family alkylhydroperoxidase
VVGDLLARATRRASLAHVRHVSPVPPRAATGLVARVYRQVERDFGMLAPPVALHSPAPATLAACWLMLRETLVAGGRVTRAAKEAVAAAVSAANRCPYCVQVHGCALIGLLRGPDARAVAADRVHAVQDPALREVARWARASASGAAPPPPAEHSAELVGVAVTFHYLNRMVNVFLSESPLPPVPAAARSGASWLAARVLGSLAGRSRAAGAALPLLPAVPVPADLAWAGPGTIAQAFARAAGVVDEAAARALPDRVRDLVLTRIGAWSGQPPGVTAAAWSAEEVAGLPAPERPLARLALLTALASYQVTDAVVADFRRVQPADRTLVEVTAWASLAAARRIGARLVG